MAYVLSHGLARRPGPPEELARLPLRSAIELASRDRWGCRWVVATADELASSRATLVYAALDCERGGGLVYARGSTGPRVRLEVLR